MSRSAVHNFREVIPLLAVDGNRLFDAERGSSRLLRALMRYGAIHGLPNIAPEECRSRAHRPQSSSAARRFRENRWTPAEDEIARAARAEGLSFSRIALRLLGRTEFAVAARLRAIRSRRGHDGRVYDQLPQSRCGVAPSPAEGVLPIVVDSDDVHWGFACGPADGGSIES